MRGWADDGRSSSRRFEDGERIGRAEPADIGPLISTEMVYFVMRNCEYVYGCERAYTTLGLDRSAEYGSPCTRTISCLDARTHFVGQLANGCTLNNERNRKAEKNFGNKLNTFEKNFNNIKSYFQKLNFHKPCCCTLMGIHRVKVVNIFPTFIPE